MAANPTDFAVQSSGCIELGALVHRDSREEVADLLTAMDAAFGRALAAQPPQLVVAQACLRGLTSNIVFNRPLTLLVNRSTHTVEHLIQMLKLFPDDRDLNERWLQAIAGSASSVAPELTPMVASLGGFDVLFSAIDRYADDPDVMMSAWRGLSDHSHNPVGAEIIANHGGPMQGIGWVVEQMRTHPEPGLAEGLDHLTLKYEIMQIVNGLLEHDAGNVYGRVLVQAEFLEQMTFAMEVEPDFRGTQDVACSCMLSLLKHDGSLASRLERLGAVGLAASAAKRFALKPDPTPWCGTTLGQAYPVTPTCGGVLAAVKG